MIYGKFKHYADGLSDAFEIRKQVFQLEQGVAAEEEFDELDKEAVHIVIYDGEKAVATGRLLKLENIFRIGRIAVLKEERGKQYGDLVVRMLADRAFQDGATEVLLNAQLQVKEFYGKIGFIPYGEEFMEAGIPHIPMKLMQGKMCSHCKK